MKDIIRGNREHAVLLEEENYRGYNYYITFNCMGHFCIYVQVPEEHKDLYTEKIEDVFYPDDAFKSLKGAELDEVKGMVYLGYCFNIPDYLPNPDLMLDYITMTEANKKDYAYNLRVLKMYQQAKETGEKCVYGRKGAMSQDKCREICKRAIDKILE